MVQKQKGVCFSLQISRNLFTGPQLNIGEKSFLCYDKTQFFNIGGNWLGQVVSKQIPSMGFPMVLKAFAGVGVLKGNRLYCYQRQHWRAELGTKEKPGFGFPCFLFRKGAFDFLRGGLFGKRKVKSQVGGNFREKAHFLD